MQLDAQVACNMFVSETWSLFVYSFWFLEDIRFACVARAASHNMTRRSRRPCVTHDRVHCGPKRKSSTSCLQLSAERSTRGKQHQTVWKQCLRWVKVLHFMIWRLPTENLFASGDARSQKFFSQLPNQTNIYILKWQRDVAAALHT